MSVFNYSRDVVMQSKIRIPLDKATAQSIFHQYYEAEKNKRWFAMPPFVFIDHKEENFQEGSKATLSFGMPPFSYDAVCVKCEPNKGIRAELKGRLQGVLEFEIQKSNHDWELRYTLKCRGSTPFWHLYYFAGCYIPHGPYMKYRLNKLRNYAIEERGFYGEAD